MYSYTQAKKKSFFKEDSKLWLIFLSAVSSLMLLFSLFIYFQAYAYKDQNSNNRDTINDLKEKTLKLEKKKEFILKQKRLVAEVQVGNELLRESVNNILDLIPDPVTLSHIEIAKQSLTIYGMTPTKEIYNILLLPPLKSIFTTTTTNFYRLDNGYYNFESVNELRDEQ